MKMKKYILLMAAAVMGLWSCQSELEKVTLVDPSQVVAPVLHELPGEITITADNMSEEVVFGWEKADFGQPVQYAYSLYATTDDINSIVVLYSNMSGVSQKITYEKFNQLVTTKKDKGGLGLPTGIATEVSFFVGATVGSNYQTFYSNARTVLVTPTEAEREYEMVWLPGSANGWNHGKANHLFCYAEDGNTFVGVTDFGADFASNQFKITGAADWADATGNWGMADPTAAPESGSITLLNGSNDNISIYTAHRYYHFTFTKANLGLTKDAGFDKVGVIGLNGDWDNDIVMTLSSKQIFYVDIDAASDTEFKFRLDGGWDFNWGGDMEGLTPGGSNIAVAAGQYRVYFNLNDWTKPTARLDASMYGKPEEGDEPEPEPEPVQVTGWNIIGLNGDWDNDILASETGNVWTAYITANDATNFKWRKDGGWDENYGGVMADYGVAFEAVPGGDNINVDAGFYKVVLDLSGDQPMITVFKDVTVWGLIGVNGDWNNDIYMFEADGQWISPVTTIEGEFKLRKNHDWAENRGGAFASIGIPFDAVADGPNINLPKGEYVVTYDPANETITVDGALPSDKWSLIGVAGDWSNDVFMRELTSGIWVSPAMEFGGEFKLRFNHDWAVNRGGTFENPGESIKAIQDGPNLNVPEGKWQVVYNPVLETITINNCVEAWSVIGEFEGAGWDFDLYLSQKPSGIFMSDPFLATGGFKIRFNGGWDENRGGTFEADGVAFDAVPGGSNISVGEDPVMFKLIYVPEEEKIILEQVWCIIGEVNSTAWGQDFAMFETASGIWEGAAVVNGGFKIRKSNNWDVNRGGVLEALDTPFAVTNNGENITVPETGKKYKVVYKEEDETITVSEF
jgi:hypothetical protein